MNLFCIKFNKLNNIPTKYAKISYIQKYHMQFHTPQQIHGDKIEYLTKWW